MDERSWRRYVSAYHDARPGITERLLGLAEASPYAWLAEPCGPCRAPCWTWRADRHLTRAELAGANWVGVDLSAGELAEAARRGRGPLVRAGADALPFGAATAGAVCAAMCLPVLRPCRGC